MKEDIEDPPPMQQQSSKMIKSTTKARK